MNSLAFSLAALLFVVSCKDTKKQAPPSPPAATPGSGSSTAGSGSDVATAPPAPSVDAAAAAGSADPSCPALPAFENGEEKSEDLDFNGDGVKDVVVAPGPGDCGSEECLHGLYVVRGKCFDPVGDVINFPELLKTKHNGFYDVKVTVRISGKAEHATYTFDGKTYVTK